jgi:hypothetical protein
MSFRFDNHSDPKQKRCELHRIGKESYIGNVGYEIGLRLRGMVTVNVEPSPGVDSTAISAP